MVRVKMPLITTGEVFAGKITLVLTCQFPVSPPRDETKAQSDNDWGNQDAKPSVEVLCGA